MVDKNDRFIVIDTETTNTIDDPLCYDIGFAVVDVNGNVYEKHSFIISEIFLDKDFMQSAYYAEKVPRYWEGIKNREHVLTSFFTVKKIFADCVYRNNVKIILAHNARFDYRALNLTQRFLTSSKYRYFFPRGLEVWDTLKMSREVLKRNNCYGAFCCINNYVTKRSFNRYTAEIIYRFIKNDVSFIESHTGLADVLIEKEIFAYCLLANPEINGILWETQFLIKTA